MLPSSHSSPGSSLPLPQSGPDSSEPPDPPEPPAPGSCPPEPPVPTDPPEPASPPLSLSGSESPQAIEKADRQTRNIAIRKAFVFMMTSRRQAARASYL